MKPVRNDKLVHPIREEIKKGTHCRICARVFYSYGFEPHHIFFGSGAHGPKDDRFTVPLCKKCHGTGKLAAHGSDATEVQVILARRWVEENPDRKEELFGYKPAFRHYIK